MRWRAAPHKEAGSRAPARDCTEGGKGKVEEINHGMKRPMTSMFARIVPLSIVINSLLCR